MDDLAGKVRAYVIEQGLVQPGEDVVVGVSGGPDSVCLLHVLCGMRDEFGFDLHVAHLHHGLRGEEADADAEYVRRLAESLGLGCTVECVDVPGLAREKRMAFEEAARRARYSFLAKVAVEVGARAIAVGHNASDQAETVLMHIVRGSGLAGLRGMASNMALGEYRLVDDQDGTGRQDSSSRQEWCSLRDGISQQDRTGLDLGLIRPLLEVPRAEIEAYCETHRLAPRFDRSNLDTTYFRNWLRHEVFPLLEQHNPNLQETLRRTARVVADDYALLRSVGKDAWQRVVVDDVHAVVFDRAAWRDLPTSLQRSTLREAVHRRRRSLRDINFVHIEDALRVARDGNTGHQATLPQGLMLTVGYTHLAIGESGYQGQMPDWPQLESGAEPLVVDVPGETALPGSNWVLSAKVVACEALPPGWRANEDGWRAFVAVGQVRGRLCLRTRRPGDRFHPLGMGGHGVNLADFLTNQKVPHHLRDRLPLLADAAGIVWVCGHRIDERQRVADEPGRVLVLAFERRDG